MYQLITGLINQANEVGLIECRDNIYVRNQIMNLLQLEDFPPVETPSEDTIPNLLEKIVEYATEQRVIDNLFDEQEMLAAKIMNCFMPRPSDVEHTFYKKYAEAPEKATNYFYKLSQDSNYIQMNRIRKNIRFKAETNYGELDITINLSKPEKDPEQIKRELEMKPKLSDVSYPKCVLCPENEGYVGRIGYAARANHRTISMPILDETWYLQYSPYVYYNEHCILLSEEHRDMVINRTAFQRLLMFVEKFPHYFIGSNADLPIVGGSILTHDHYQGGRYEFAMTNAEELLSFELENFPQIEATILKWPLSVIRLRCKEMESLVEAGDQILENWKTYNDKHAKILAFTGDTPHNTITPIARRREDQFELDLVLRNNRTTDEHPLGIFHPHADVHHIKKENIGLIEVMGLAVLPARLKDELEDIKDFLMDKDATVIEYHQAWADEMKAHYGVIDSYEEVNKIIEVELGKKFSRVLEDAGVFKQTEEGINAFQRFITHLNG